MCEEKIELPLQYQDQYNLNSISKREEACHQDPELYSDASEREQT